MCRFLYIQDGSGSTVTDNRSERFGLKESRLGSHGFRGTFANHVEKIEPFRCLRRKTRVVRGGQTVFHGVDRVGTTRGRDTF